MVGGSGRWRFGMGRDEGRIDAEASGTITEPNGIDLRFGTCLRGGFVPEMRKVRRLLLTTCH